MEASCCNVEYRVKVSALSLRLSRRSHVSALYARSLRIHHNCRHFLMCRDLGISRGKGHRISIADASCKKTSTESSPGVRKTEYNHGRERSFGRGGLRSDESIPLNGIRVDVIYTPSEDFSTCKHDLIKSDALDSYSESLQAVVGQRRLTKKTVSDTKQKKTLDCLVKKSSSEDDHITALKGLKNLGKAYSSPLMLLIGAGYWIQGFRCFPWFIVSFYLKDAVGIDPGTLQIIQNTVNLPMVAKPVYGIISDTVYIRGAHRVPYLVIGGVLQALSWATIAFLPGNGSSISVITVLLALSNLGASIVDVANDAMVAECAKKSKNTGELQSFAWLATAVGGVLGNLIAACALQCTDFRGIFGIFGMLLAFQAGHTMGVDEGFLGLRSADSIDVDIESRFKVVEMQPVEHISNNSIISKREPYVFAFEESPNMWRPSIDRSNTYYPIPRTMRSDALVVQQNPKHVGMRQHFIELFNLVKRPEILGPVSWFMSSYALIPTLAGSMFFFQTQQLNIDPSVVGMAKVMGQIGLVGGSMVYTRYLKGVPLRKLLGSLQVLLSFCMLFDILLVKRMNVGVGIPDAVMVMGASAFVDAINQFKMLPFMVLLAQLCPVGSEGSLLAAFMSLQCLSTIISGYMGVTLTSMLHITCNDYSELPTGIMLESTAALLPLLWISLIPEKAARSSNEFHRGHGK